MAQPKPKFRFNLQAGRDCMVRASDFAELQQAVLDASPGHQVVILMGEQQLTQSAWEDDVLTAWAATQPGALSLAVQYFASAPQAAPQAGSFRQIDGHRQASLGRFGTPMSSNDKMMFANLAIANDRVDPSRSCNADIMLDCGCSMELVLPAKKAVQLQLRKMDERTARGFEGQLVAMTTFAPVLVTIALAYGDKVMKKEAYLQPSSRTRDYEQALLERRDMPKVSSEYPKEQDGMLEVSPVKRHGKPEDVANCLLGIEGLYKLRLTVDFENSVIMPVVVEEMIL